MLFPVCRSKLVANQAVRGFLVGNAQQGFGKAHEHHAFLTGKLVLLHESVDAALADAVVAHLGNQRAGVLGDALQGLGVEMRRIQQRVDHLCLVTAVPAGDFAAQPPALG